MLLQAFEVAKEGATSDPDPSPLDTPFKLNIDATDVRCVADHCQLYTYSVTRWVCVRTPNRAVGLSFTLKVLDAGAQKVSNFAGRS